jgi:hypothetical protein
VENGAPLAIRHPLDGGAVVDAGNIAAVKRAVYLRLAGDGGGVRIGHDDFQSRFGGIRTKRKDRKSTYPHQIGKYLDCRHTCSLR